MGFNFLLPIELVMIMAVCLLLKLMPLIIWYSFPLDVFLPLVLCNDCCKIYFGFNFNWCLFQVIHADFKKAKEKVMFKKKEGVPEGLYMWSSSIKVLEYSVMHKLFILDEAYPSRQLLHHSLLFSYSLDKMMLFNHWIYFANQWMKLALDRYEYEVYLIGCCAVKLSSLF